MGRVLFAVVAIFGTCDATVRADEPVAARKALAALRELEPVVKVDEAKPDKPVVAVHFLPNFGKVTDDHLAHLKAFPHLRSVEVANKPFVTDAGLAHLAALDQLEGLVLNGTGVTAEAVVRFLKGRTKLHRLHLARVPLRDDDLTALKELTELRDLSLRGTLVSDKGVEHLKALTKLRRLNLDTKGRQITDAALPHLGGLTDLEYLDLDRTAITDAGMAHLQSFKKLRGLQFAFTSVTDSGLEHLHGLTDLTSVNARGTKVTKAGVDKLKQKLPEVEVGYGPAPK
jgi:hypothetical protein